MLDDNKKTDNNMYISISAGYNLHFWGNWGLLILLKERFHFRFTSAQTDILEQCNGQHTVNTIVSRIVSQYKGEKEQLQKAREKIKNFLYSLIRKGYLSLSTQSQDVSIGKYGRFSGERGKYYPFDISIELTSRCNFKCSFCYKNSEHIGEDIGLDQLRWIKDNLAGKIKEVRLMGGEPTIFPYFQDVISIFSDDFLLSIVTNGSVLYRYPVDIVKQLDNVQISLYGYSPESYYKNTGMQGWQSVLKSVKTANDAGIETRGCVTLSREAIDNFELYIQAAIDLDIKRLSFGIPSPVGRAQKSFNTEDGINLSPEDKRQLYRLMREMKLKYANKIDLTVWQHGSLTKEQKKVAFDECDGCLDCGGGWYSLVISEKAHVRPCELLDAQIFDYGGLDAITKIAEGYFFEKELDSFIPILERELHRDGIQLNDVCPTLERFRQRKYVGE